MIIFRIQSSSLMLHIHTHTMELEITSCTLRYAENKCCPLISKNSDLAHVIPLH